MESTDTPEFKRRSYESARIPPDRPHVDKSRPLPWHAGWFRAMWQRERDKSPRVAALTPGTKLHARWFGTDWEVIYQDGYVEWNGHRWPTLLDVRHAIAPPRVYRVGKRKTRALSNLNTPQFFGLVTYKRVGTRLVEVGCLSKPTP